MKKPIIKLTWIPAFMLMFFMLGSCNSNAQNNNAKNKKTMNDNPYYSRTDTTKLNVSDAEWKKILPSELYDVARQAATERSFTGNMWKDDTKGSYFCAVCGNALFKADAKFSSTCGWPSFFEPLRTNNMIYKEDNSVGMQRTEVLCARCDSHLGHIFDDGPPPTGKRYCMNAVSLDFVPDK